MHILNRESLNQRSYNHSIRALHAAANQVVDDLADYMDLSGEQEDDLREYLHSLLHQFVSSKLEEAEWFRSFKDHWAWWQAIHTTSDLLRMFEETRRHGIAWIAESLSVSASASLTEADMHCLCHTSIRMFRCFLIAAVLEQVSLSVRDRTLMATDMDGFRNWHFDSIDMEYTGGSLLISQESINSHPQKRFWNTGSNSDIPGRDATEPSEEQGDPDSLDTLEDELSGL